MSYSGPCYSNIDTIKRAMVQANRPLSLKEIVLYVQTNWAGGLGIDETTANELVNSAIYTPKTKFEYVENAGWWYKKEEWDQVKHQIIKKAYDFLCISSKPIHSGQLTIQIATYLNSSRKHIDIDILRFDLRFTNICNRWLLAKWELLNDLVFEYMIENQKMSMSIKEAEIMIRKEYKVDNHNAIFAPEVDKRFKIVDNLVEIDPMKRKFEERSVRVPQAVYDEIEIHMDTIIQTIKQSASNSCTSAELLKKTTGITREKNSYRIYENALSEKLKQQRSVVMVGINEWVCSSDLLQIEDTSVIEQDHILNLDYPIGQAEKGEQVEKDDILLEELEGSAVEKVAKDDDSILQSVYPTAKITDVFEQLKVAFNQLDKTIYEKGIPTLSRQYDRENMTKALEIADKIGAILESVKRLESDWFSLESKYQSIFNLLLQSNMEENRDILNRK